MKRLGFATLTLLLALLCLSCVRRPLLDPEDNALLKISLTTSDINNVTCNIYNDKIPRPELKSDKLRVFIYQAADNLQTSQGFVPNVGVDENGYQLFSGAIALSPGEYKMLGYNFDIADTFIDGDDNYNTCRAYTYGVSESLYSRFGTRVSRSEKVFYQPEHVFVADESDIVVEPHIGEKVIYSYAHTIVYTYYIQIRISGQQHIAQKAAGLALLSGLSSSKLLADGTLSEEPCSLYFEMQQSTDENIADENKNVLCAVFNTFGRIDTAESKLKVTFSVLTRDGKTHQKEVDMESIFATEDAQQRHWLIIDEVWDIPEPIMPEGSGGFNPEVDEWEDVTEVIPIGPRE